MRFAVIAAAMAAAATAEAASAGERISDSDYIRASRCRGLAGSEALGPVETGSLDAFLKDAGRARSEAVRELASQAQQRAAREAKSPERKAQLQGELAGACLAYLKPAGGVAAP